MLPAQHQIQEWVHRLEEREGARAVKFLLAALVFAALMLVYNLREFKNMSNAEAMDAAQLARNLAEHKGYRTLFVRPVDTWLLQKGNSNSAAAANANDGTEMPPDLANAPVYPAVLAALMKAMPAFKYQTAGSQAAWNRSGKFSIYRPDFLISLSNQFLLLAAAMMIFFIALRWFDPGVAWTSTIVFVGTDLFWRFSISGLSTMLLVVIFLGLVWCLALLDEGVRGGRSVARLMLLAAAIGILTGVGGLTRYAFGWLIIPTVVFLFVFMAGKRAALALTALAAFAAVMTPWVLRNYHLSHTPFGFAGYALFEGTPAFPGHSLERALHPNLSLIDIGQLWDKFIVNTRNILRDELPRTGGNWASAFFLAGLLMRFKNPALGRLRVFAVLCLPVLVVAQALGRTQWSEDSPIINSENLLVIASPLIIIFGVSFFFTLLEQWEPAAPAARYFMAGIFCVVLCLPTALTFISTRPNAVAYPPYYPPIIQQTADWMKPNELVMSDVPWAVAWYGRRQSIWLTLNTQEDFASVNARQPVSAIYLTPLTLNQRFVSDGVQGGEHNWATFAFNAILKQELPGGFPLNKMPTEFLPEQLFLTDSVRWK